MNMQRKQDFSKYGDISKYSFGMQAAMADRQIQRVLDCNVFTLTRHSDGNAVIQEKTSGKWFLYEGEFGNDDIPTQMLGAACGDTAGSVYEHFNIKYKLNPEKLIGHQCRFTDDTVMTCAVADGLMKALRTFPDNWQTDKAAIAQAEASVRDSLVYYGMKFPYAGYGRGFWHWLTSEHVPYHSWGNGSAMRASYPGWIAKSLEEAELLAEISAKVSHNHPEGINGAKAVAGSIYLLKTGQDKNAVKKYVSQYYDMNFTLDEIRPSYRFDVSCQGSVPQAITAFLEADSFSDAVSAAISIGGDSDTIAAIAGSLAEAYYPIPRGVRSRVIDRLDTMLIETITNTVDYLHERLD